MKASCHVEGLDTLQGKITRQKIKVKREAKKVCLAEAEEIMKESLAEVPRDTEALADSAFIEQQENGDVIFGYGKDNVQTNPKSGRLTSEYMMAVHERLDVHHDVGKAKFLEDPINRNKGKLEKSFAQKLKRAFGL